MLLLTLRFQMFLHLTLDLWVERLGSIHPQKIEVLLVLRIVNLSLGCSMLLGVLILAKQHLPIFLFKLIVHCGVFLVIKLIKNYLIPYYYDERNPNHSISNPSN